MIIVAKRFSIIIVILCMCDCVVSFQETNKEFVWKRVNKNNIDNFSSMNDDDDELFLDFKTCCNDINIVFFFVKCWSLKRIYFKCIIENQSYLTIKKNNQFDGCNGFFSIIYFSNDKHNGMMLMIIIRICSFSSQQKKIFILINYEEWMKEFQPHYQTISNDNYSTKLCKTKINWKELMRKFV